MTEVDVSIPESSTLSTTNNNVIIATSTTDSVNNNNNNINNNNNNNNNNNTTMITSPTTIVSAQNNGTIKNDRSIESMEVDGDGENELDKHSIMETDEEDADADEDDDEEEDEDDEGEDEDAEEEDSRQTSSTGVKVVADKTSPIESFNMNDNNTKSGIMTGKSISQLNENSSNACDGSEKMNAHNFDSSTEEMKNVDEDNSNKMNVQNERLENEIDDNTNTNNNSSSSSTQADNKNSNQSNSDNNDDDNENAENADAESSSHEGLPSSKSPSKSNVNADDSSSDSKPATPIEDPLAVTRKENGSINNNSNNDNNLHLDSKSPKDSFVDLGDDSDVEISEVLEKKVSKSFADSDGAVVIGSDSDECDNGDAEDKLSKPQCNSTLPTSNQSMPQTPSASSHIIDDDDDDCVVIEDDGLSPSLEDFSKRKIGIVDNGNSNDDTHLQMKRLRPMQNVSNMSQQQFAIKDARSLASSATDSSPKRNDAGIYPVNITPATSNFIGVGPPKLVPVGSAMLTSPMSMGLTPIGAGLPNMTNNASLLPGLTDDMFVLEAPSFIVPYIYEKPPTSVIKEVVKALESQFAFSKEDLAEVDKTDEFDMTTEQNKEDRETKNPKNNKRRRRNDDVDDSWSEDSDDDDDDDDDSESGMRTKILIKEASDDIAVLKGAIKPASAVAQSGNQSPSVTKPGQENYFESPLGRFFMDIGVGLVQEFVQSDLIRLQKRKMRKSLGRNVTEFERAIAALTLNLEASKKKNAPFKFNMKRCEFCNFKSESALAMANHYETPHTNGALYKCNFCIFETPQRNTTEIVYHMEAIHNIKARLIKPLPYHQCPNCGFEDNGKAKLARHQPVCAKKFRPELNLTPPSDWEAPAKIPRIKPRHGLVGTATAYQAMAAQQKAALASIQQQQQARNMQAAALAAQTAANKMRGRAPPMPQKPAGPVVSPGPPGLIRNPNQIRNPSATNVVLPNNYQVGPGGLLLPQTVNKKLLNQPSISITPLPRQSPVTSPSSNLPSTSKTPPNNMKPGQTVGGKDAKFVICEICDGYIKDLESLRNHMQWIHKVKIHPKMIYNRPPLNCQKCQFRFFTDQGLERHLLGSHGLVTSSMQEAANKGKDAGRCPVCGRVYQWKLLNHVSRDHHMTLKPAHLSYKCTVCTATFGMYKQFETHVYTAHSTVAKKAMDGKKNSPVPSNNQSGSSIAGSVQRIAGLSAASDSLLKPLKINDEITIIPQPASKSRLSNIDTHVID